MKKEMATKKKHLKRTLEICTFLGAENGFLNMTLKSETKEKNWDCMKKSTLPMAKPLQTKQKGK